MTNLWRFIQSGGQDLAGLLSFLVGLIIAITVHEFAHAKRAQMAGDPTAEQAGRVTLNPIAHLDPIGTIMLLFAGFGWGKPVPVNRFLFRRPRYDDIMVSLWGPGANVITAFLFGIPLKLGVAGDYAVVLDAIVWLNLVLAIFNLIPIYPLDGSHILSDLLPTEQAQKLDDFYSKFGMILLILLIMSRLTVYVVGIPVAFLHHILASPLFFVLGLLALRRNPAGRGTESRTDP